MASVSECVFREAMKGSTARLEDIEHSTRISDGNEVQPVTMDAVSVAVSEPTR